MATYTKVKLSGADALNTPFDSSTGSWVTVHQTGTSSTTLDEIWLWVSNYDQVNTASMSMRFYRDDLGLAFPFSRFTIPPQTTLLVLSGHISSGNGSTYSKLQVFETSADTYIYGYVNRITP